MYDSRNEYLEDARLKIYQAINEIEKCSPHRSRSYAIARLEEAIMWLDWQPRTSNGK
jgi:hypothetical protein